MAKAIAATLILALGSAAPLLAQKDSVYVTIIGDTVRAWDINIEENCASRFAVTVERVGPEVYTVTERDTVGAIANCICTYFIYATLPGISAPGAYAVRMYREYLKRYGYEADTTIFIGAADFTITGEVVSQIPAGWYQSKCRDVPPVLEQVPQLLSPPDSAIIYGYFAFAWSAVSGAIAFHLQASLDQLFRGSFIVNDSTLTDTMCVAFPPRDSTLIQPTAGRYYWRVRARTPQGWMSWSTATRSFVLSPCAVASARAGPAACCLFQNYPNPFNPATVIRYTLSQRSRVTLSVYDVLGRLVATVFNGEEDPGQHTVIFDGSSLSSGVYFYRLQAGSFVKTMKMLSVK